MTSIAQFENINPYVFITEFLIPEYSNDSRILICVKPDDPKKKTPWIPQVLTEDLPLPSNANLYISISTCRKVDDSESKYNGQYRNRLDCATQCHMFMLDDLGDETTANKPDYNNLPLKPTWIIETSPHNYQALYVLTEALEDIALANQITKQLPGQTRTDKSSVNAVRWARLPGGINNKEEYMSDDTPLHIVRIESAAPECTSTWS